MRSSIINGVVVLLGLGKYVVNASPIAQRGAVITTSNLIFEGSVVPGGPNVTIKGTYEEIRAEVFALNPNYNPADFSTTKTAAPAERLAKRSKSKLICDVQGGAKANWEDVEFLLEYWNFNQNPGPPNLRIEVGPGPRTCTKFTEYETAVFWLCNDNAYSIQSAFPYLLSYAADIYYSNCGTDAGVNGQEFDSVNYNVIVEKNCNTPHC